MGAFRIAHIWHSNITIQRIPGAGQTQTILVILPISGQAILSISGHSYELRAGMFAVTRAGTHLTYESTNPTARMEIEVRLSDDLNYLPEVGDVWTGAGAGILDILVDTVNSALRADLQLSPQELLSVRGAVTELTASLLAGTFAAPAMSGATAAIFRAGCHIIRVHAADPAFGVRHVAQQVAVSERYLFRAFVSHGTTPSAALRSERVQRARALLEAQGELRPGDLTRIAYKAGFSSTRTLRAALKK